MNRRLPRSVADDERGEGGRWPDTSEGLLGRPTDAGPAPQPATSDAVSYTHLTLPTN